MAETSVVGCSWIELPATKWKLRGQFGHKMELTTRCQLEVDIAWDEFIAHAPEGEWSKIAPFRILSFDIECAGREGNCSFCFSFIMSINIVNFCCRYFPRSETRFGDSDRQHGHKARRIGTISKEYFYFWHVRTYRRLSGVEF